MTTSLLSPGAQRVVDRLQVAVPCTEIDVLQSLWIDESRAQEFLSVAGATDSALQDVATRLRPAECVTWPIPEFLRVAQQLVQQMGRAEEIRTEHLLAAALEFSAFRDLLGQIGVETGPLRQKLHLPVAVAATPIESDIQLRTAPAIHSESVSVARILDASANRCREGLRVVEDYARMILNDAHLSRQVKEIRHALAPLLSRLHVDEAIQSRDTAHDVGTTIHTAFEMARPSAWSVAVANTKRVQEALRTLEEYGKTVDSLAASAFGALRYRFYTIEKGMHATQGAVEKLKNCQLYLLVTDNLCPQGVGPVIQAALRGGVDVVQLREKRMPDRQFLELAKWVRQWTAEAETLLIVNDRPDLAYLVEADGVHVGQGDLSTHEARNIMGGHKLVGVSTHGIDQARQAVLDGADYLGVGPVFSSPTKDFEEFAGLEYVEQVAQEIALPAFAIGGIGLENIAPVLAAGSRRIAVSSEICRAENPERVAARLKEALMMIRQAEA